MNKKIVYIDFENMASIKELYPIKGKYMIFIGRQQEKIPKALALATQNNNVQWIEIDGTGKNALDFHIAYFLGKIDLCSGDIHYILSKDKGYDPLIKYINRNSGKKVVIRIETLDCLKEPTKKEICKKNNDNKNEDAFSNLKNRLKVLDKKNRPKRYSAMKAFARMQVSKALKDDEIQVYIDRLSKAGFLHMDSKKHITYLN